MAMQEADTRPMSGANTVSPKEVHRQRNGCPALKQISFDWSAPEMYVELLNLEIEVTNILQLKTCNLTEEVPIIKHAKQLEHCFPH